MASSRTVDLFRQSLKKLAQNGGFDAFVDTLRVISADQNHLVCEMTVSERHVNAFGTLHGGCTATLVDVVSSLPLIVNPPHLLAVSVDLSVSYMKAVKLGEAIVIEAKNIKVGKALAFLEVDIKRKCDGQLVATGKHTKFISDGQTHHL